MTYVSIHAAEATYALEDFSTISGSLTVDTAVVVKSGAASYKADSGAGNVPAFGEPAVAAGAGSSNTSGRDYQSCWLMLDSLPASTVGVCAYRGIYAAVGSQGALYLYWSSYTDWSSPILLATATGVQLSVGTPYHITIARAGGGTGFSYLYRAELFLNGRLVAQYSIDANNYQGGSSGMGWLHAPGANRTLHFNHITDERQVSGDPSYPGDIRVTAKRPASVYSNQYTTTGGNGAVNERPVSETNYMAETGKTSLEQSYYLEPAEQGDVSLTTPILSQQGTATGYQMFYGTPYYLYTKFTATEAVSLGSVRLSLSRFGSPGGNLVVSLRAADGLGKPQGSDLATISVAASSLDVNKEIILGLTYSLSAGTDYTLLVSLPNGDVNNRLSWNVGAASLGSSICGHGDGSTWSLLAGSPRPIFTLYTSTLAVTPYAYSAWMWWKTSATKNPGNQAILYPHGSATVSETLYASLASVYTQNSPYAVAVPEVGQNSTGTADDIYLYECGVLIAYRSNTHALQVSQSVALSEAKRPHVKRYLTTGEDLANDFSAASLDESKWTFFRTDAFSTVTQTDGDLVLALGTVNATAGIISKRGLDFTNGGSVYFRLSTSNTANTSMELVFDDNNFIGVIYAQTANAWSLTSASSDGTGGSVGIAAGVAEDAYFRIRLEGNTWYVDYSTDPGLGSWTNTWSRSRDELIFAVDDLAVRLQAASVGSLTTGRVVLFNMLEGGASALSVDRSSPTYDEEIGHSEAVSLAVSDAAIGRTESLGAPAEAPSLALALPGVAAAETGTLDDDVSVQVKATTRLYLSYAVSSNTPAGWVGGWNATPSGNTGPMDLAKTGDAGLLGRSETSGSAITNANGRWVSERTLVAGEISGSLLWTVGLKESADGMNASTKLTLYVMKPDGTNRGTLASVVESTEWPTSATARGNEAPVAMTPVTAEAGDRLVVEIGYYANNTDTTSFAGTVYFGGQGDDMVPGYADPQSQAAWMELDGELFGTVVLDLAVSRATPTYDEEVGTAEGAAVQLSALAASAAESVPAVSEAVSGTVASVLAVSDQVSVEDVAHRYQDDVRVTESVSVQAAALSISASEAVSAQDAPTLAPATRALGVSEVVGHTEVVTGSINLALSVVQTLGAPVDTVLLGPVQLSRAVLDTLPSPTDVASLTAILVAASAAQAVGLAETTSLAVGVATVGVTEPVGVAEWVDREVISLEEPALGVWIDPNSEAGWVTGVKVRG